jgi:hypothetical protein
MPAQMEQYCLQNPRCGQKLNQARQGLRPAAPLPAATAPSQEDQLRRQLLPIPPAQNMPLLGPRSHAPSATERLFSWLNPFASDLAWAQTPFSVTLTPDNRGVAGSSTYLGLYGGYMVNLPVYIMTNTLTTINSPNTESKPYVYATSNLPTAGYYLIDIVASPSLTKFRHSSGQIVETWDDRAGCGGPSTCHHVAVDYYAAGQHYWYFWVDPTVGGTVFYSITIKSYP